MSKQGSCFRSAARFVMDAGGIESMSLAHGVVVGAKGEVKGRKHDHAWVEIEDVVVDTESGWIGRREDFYQQGQVYDVRLYDREQTLVNLLRFKHWGPWDEEAGGRKRDH